MFIRELGIKTYCIKKSFFQKDGLFHVINYYQSGKLKLFQFYFHDDTLLKKITETNFVNKKIKTFEYQYDKRKRLILERVKDKKGVVLSEQKYEYGNNSITIYSRDNHYGVIANRIEKTVYDTSAKPLITSIVTVNVTSNLRDTIFFKYNANGVLLEELKNEHGFIRKKRYEYDSFGRNILIEVLNSDNEVTRKSYKTFTQTEELVSDYSFLSPRDSLLIRKQVFQFNKSKRLIEDINFYDTNELDQARLNKGSGIQYFYNRVGTSKIIFIRSGKPSDQYYIKYNE